MVDFTFQVAIFLHGIVFNLVSLTVATIVLWSGIFRLVYLLMREYFKQRGNQGE